MEPGSPSLLHANQRRLSICAASSGRERAGGLRRSGGVDGGVTSCSGRRPVGPHGGTLPLLLPLLLPRASGVILPEPLVCNLKKKEAAKWRRKRHRHGCAALPKVEIDE